MAKGSYRKVKSSARDGYVEIDVGTTLKIIVCTPSGDLADGKFVVFFKDKKTDEDLVILAVSEKQLKK